MNIKYFMNPASIRCCVFHVIDWNTKITNFNKRGILLIVLSVVSYAINMQSVCYIFNINFLLTSIYFSFPALSYFCIWKPLRFGQNTFMLMSWITHVFYSLKIQLSFSKNKCYWLVYCYWSFYFCHKLFFNLLNN